MAGRRSRADSCRFGIVGCSKCVVEKRLEQVFCLTQRLAPHRTYALHSPHQLQESLLMADVWHRDAHLANLI